MVSSEQLIRLMKKHANRGGYIDSDDPRSATVDAYIDIDALVSDLNQELAGQ